MVSRTPAEAVNSYIESIQLAISCITYSVVTVRGGYYPSDRPHTLSLNDGSPVRLGGISRLRLLIEQQYRVLQLDTPTGLWTVDVVNYQYAVFDTNDREVLAYHWHPVGQSPVVTPHLHIGHGAMAGRPEIGNAHLPTGHVSTIEILRMLIRDFAVVPRRRDWESVLDEALDPTT